MSNSDESKAILIFEATGYRSPDPKTTTRTDFTNFFLRFQHAPDASPVYKHVFVTHQRLAKLLIEHPAMRPNLQQTFSTPANSKNKVYFMWDFVLRTFQHLAAQVDPRDPHSSPMFEDVFIRLMEAKMLTVDNTKKLNKMNMSVGYSDDDGVEFGDEIKQLADTLDKFPEGCAACGKEQRDDGRPLLICARCKDEKYCSINCQKQRWKSHKRGCQAAKGAAS